MRFEENSNCDFEEKVNLVTKEIIDVYPDISSEKAKEIAILDETINKPANNDTKFVRYYYMLLVLNQNPHYKKEFFSKMFDLINLGLEDEKLYFLFTEVYNFMSGRRLDYPMISEMYES